ncbi:MAG: CapA family protein [Alphaproteobacteria bacterium]|nr:CapA family protein [Alphaproteobacteria bacterium]
MTLLLLLAGLALAGEDPYFDGLVALKAGEIERAEALLEQAVEATPDRVEAWWELGWARWRQEDWAGVVAAWERVAVLAPDHPDLGEHLPTARARAALAAAPAPGPVPVAEAPSGGRTVTFAAGGDTMMGTALRKGAAGLAEGNGEALFTGVDGWLRAADVAFLNLEGPLADDLPQTKCGPNSKHCYAFSTPTRYRAALVDMGVDVASLANNHAMDLGMAGMESTMRTLDEVGIAHAGRYGDTAYLERDGLTIAVVAAHSGSCCLNVNDLDEVRAAVAQADANADLVVLSFHGGAEGADHRHVPGQVEIAWGERRGDVNALAHAAVDAGADLVLGHGPHVLRAMEVYRGRLVVYSMGNFCGYNQFGTEGGYGGTSMVVEATLDENGALVRATVHAVALDSLARPRPDPTGAAHAQVNELSAADFPETGVRVDPDGAVRWGAAR